MNNIVKTIVELRIFLASLGTLLAAAGLNWESVLPYVYEFNVHLMLMMSIGFGLTYFVSTRGHKVLQEQITQTNSVITDIMLDADRSRLRTTVKQTYKDYMEVEEIDFETTQKYILDLEKQMAKLGVNSFSSDMIKQLKSKFKVR